VTGWLRRDEVRRLDNLEPETAEQARQVQQEAARTAAPPAEPAKVVRFSDGRTAEIATSREGERALLAELAPTNGRTRA
jgi:hypothetical protein